MIENTETRPEDATDELNSEAAPLPSSASGGGLKIAPKLIAIFMTFGLTPALVLFAILWIQGSIIKDAFMSRAEVTAVALNDLIDRNLFERYGDVQAFTLNTAVQDRANWSAGSPDNPLVRAMNGYMTGYGIYDLMLLVNLEGKVVATNSVGADGSALDTASLYGEDVSSAHWFESALNGNFLNGENGLTGTAVAQPAYEPLVSRLTGGDGYVIPFSAPVRDPSGEVIAVWVNFAAFGLVEDIVAQAYEDLKAEGMANAEVTILDPEGRIIVDYDPAGQGWSEYSRNPEVIGVFNLAEKGVEAAVAAINGDAGAIVSRHARKQIDQAAGYAHSQGAYDYPGLGWSTLVRIPVEEAFAAWDSLILSMVIALVTTVAVIASAGLAIGKGFVKPIQMLTVVMRKLADGEKDVEVPGTGRRDELGQMAATVLVFKTNALEMERLEAEQAQQAARADQEKRAAMDSLADGFESSVKVVVAGVSTAAGQMQSSTKLVSDGAEETKLLSSTVATASEQATNNVQTVASAAEELSASIGEISRQVAQSSKIATEAVGQAERTNDQVRSLVDAARSIGDVVDLISDIAEQTNLLALNATIEAARAGEAGKGFAVVASEVKSLANQTAKATEEISQQIASIQSATDDAAQAIQDVGKTVAEINDIGTAVAAAVEEQGSATEEIARNVQEASTGTQQVSTTIVQVNEAAANSGNAANEMLTATMQLSEQSKQLSQEVDRFLERVRAA